MRMYYGPYLEMQYTSAMQWRDLPKNTQLVKAKPAFEPHPLQFQSLWEIPLLRSTASFMATPKP